MADTQRLSIFIYLFAFGVAYLKSLPLEDKNNLDDLGEKNETNEEDYVLIDQRQNGSENYRINIDGVLIAFTPLESLLSGAIDDFDFSEEFDNKPNVQNGTETDASSGNATKASVKNSGKFKR